jgi:MFS family permease
MHARARVSFGSSVYSIGIDDHRRAALPAWQAHGKASHLARKAMGAVIAPEAARPLSALRHRDFAVYAVARFCVTLVWQMINVAVGWQVYELTQDPLNLGLVGLAQFLPFVALVLPAGQAVDRSDRRQVLLYSYAVSAASAALLLWSALRDGHGVWPVYLALVISGASRAYFMPASQAMTPNLVPPESLANAIAINSALLQIGLVVGPALGGALYLLGAPVVYGTCMVLLLLVLVLIAMIRPARTTAAPHSSFSSTGVLEGLRFVLAQRLVLGAISLDLFAVLFGGATALLPIYAGSVLHVGPAGLGILRTAPGIGAALTGLALTVRPIERAVGRWLFTGVAVFGAATVVFGMATSFWLSLLALTVLGAGDMLSVYIRQILVQLETPDAVRGRVSAVSSMFIGSSNTLGELESGLTASWFGTVPAVVLGGVATLLVVASYLKLFPELRHMDRFRREPPT